MTRFEDWEPPTFDDQEMTKWGWKCSHPELLYIGKNVDVGAFCYLQSQEGIVLEDDVQIGGGVKIYSVNTIDGTNGMVTIKRNARIGANSVILPGVTIGEDAVVGALSLVKDDVPASEVWGGVPARRIK